MRGRPRRWCATARRNASSAWTPSVRWRRSLSGGGRGAPRRRFRHGTRDDRGRSRPRDPDGLAGDAPAAVLAEGLLLELLPLTRAVYVRREAGVDDDRDEAGDREQERHGRRRRIPELEAAQGGG